MVIQSLRIYRILEPPICQIITGLTLKHVAENLKTDTTLDSESKVFIAGGENDLANTNRC